MGEPINNPVVDGGSGRAMTVSGKNWEAQGAPKISQPRSHMIVLRCLNHLRSEVLRG
jgi:hypothetical protein